MIQLVRSDSRNKDFMQLVEALDKDLSQRDGEDHAHYAPLNQIQNINQVVIAYNASKAMACGGMKQYSNEAVEIKRMFTTPEGRRMGLATLVLKELEAWALELDFKKCVLETGKRQPEALALYHKNGYKPIANYGPYSEMENSVCFEKLIFYNSSL
ncbi:MAG: GNAT family N-acetyltransferase [Flavisolibacter sp.]